jgi:8-oxo-dGTP pyrophosphatase MutT (NUDIX family)
MRKGFNYDNLSESKIARMSDMYPRAVTACGCLFYKVNPLRLMLIKYADPRWPRYDDCGGQIDVADSSLQEAQIREVCEETNHQIPHEEIRQRISTSTTVSYNHLTKYYVTLIKVEEEFYPDGTLFGNREDHDQIKRTIDWYPYSMVRDQLAMRLAKCKEMLDMLDSKIPQTRCLL